MGLPGQLPSSVSWAPGARPLWGDHPLPAPGAGRPVGTHLSTRQRESAVSARQPGPTPRAFRCIFGRAWGPPGCEHSPTTGGSGAPREGLSSLRRELLEGASPVALGPVGSAGLACAGASRKPQWGARRAAWRGARCAAAAASGGKLPHVWPPRVMSWTQRSRLPWIPLLRPCRSIPGWSLSGLCPPLWHPSGPR